MLFIHTFGAHAALSPHKASYTTKFKGISAELDQQLKNTNNDQWSLNNRTSVLFSTFEEKASFLIQNNRPIPGNYDYKNPLSSKRNSKLRFDWASGTVIEKAKSTPPLKLPDDALDKITFQIRLRLDLIEQGNNFKEKTYTLVEGNRLKPYILSYQGEESVTTPAGTFQAIKMKQQRPGKDKYIEIWLAKNWQYMILQIERFEKGKSKYKLALQSAEFDGKKMVAKTPSPQ